MLVRPHPRLALALRDGATLLTPSQRVARSIRSAFDDEQRAAGSTLWTPPDVLPLDLWLSRRWTGRIVAGQETRVLLNRSQELALWQEVIAESSPARSPHALAEVAAHAWSLLWRYGAQTTYAREPAAAAAARTDLRAFEGWRKALERRLKRGFYVTAAQLPALLAAAPDPDAHLALVDFDGQTPALASLLSAIERAGGRVQLLQTEAVRTEVGHPGSTLFVADDDETELAVLAAWIKTVRETHPESRVAVVVPDQAERRHRLERALTPVLNPQQSLITSPPATIPALEFSLGHPLAELPLAAAALDLLLWPLEALPIERISLLLLSPWFTGGGLPDAGTAVAAFDARELRRADLLQPALSLEATLRLVDGSRRRAKLADLLQRLQRLAAAARETHFATEDLFNKPTVRSHTGWAESFRALLNAAGWTATAESDSLAFQQHQRFLGVLDEMATLDFEGRELTAADAVATLRTLLRRTIFAPEAYRPDGQTQGEAQPVPVQILGPLEVGGAAFDSLWFLGADDLAWPAPVSPSPLLPWSLQRSLGMPGADRQRDDAQARALTERIARNSAGQVVFSYARRSEEGERRPSPLLEALDLTPLTQLAPAPPAELPRRDTVPEQTTLPPLPPGPVRGGAQVLEHQAACAFRAFAEHRLHSEPLETREPGLDALERGTLVHQVMQHFWGEVKSQRQLKALPLPERERVLAEAVEFAMGNLRAKPQTSWDDTYLAVQRRRLANLLRPWLAEELKRSEFTVELSEAPKEMKLGGLELKLRIDRTDRTPDGGLIILDYKTGKPETSEWLGQRPESPQLPLYAVLLQSEDAEIAAVAFAILRAGKDLTLKGFSEDAATLPRTTRASKMEASSLPEQVERWREVLTVLAEAFAAGDTRVEPKSYPKTCKFCQQRILCRLDPAEADSGEDEQTYGSEQEASFG